MVEEEDLAGENEAADFAADGVGGAQTAQRWRMRVWRRWWTAEFPGRVEAARGCVRIWWWDDFLGRKILRRSRVGDFGLSVEAGRGVCLGEGK